MIDEKNNPEFVGDQEKFKYLAIHGFERWQTDKEGRLRDGKTSEFVKDYCRKDEHQRHGLQLIRLKYAEVRIAFEDG